MRHGYAALAVLIGVGLGVGGCVDRDVVGTYENPGAGTLILGDDGNGGYLLFDGQTRVVHGDYRKPGPGEFLHGTNEDRGWDDTYIDWDSDEHSVTVEPIGGPPLRLQRVDDTLVLTTPDGQQWRFSRWTHPAHPADETE